MSFDDEWNLGTDWYDQTLVDVGINPATATGPATGAGDFYQDMMDSIGLTFDGDVPTWIANDTDFSKALELFKASGVDTTIRSSNVSPPLTAEAASAKNGKVEEKGGILGKLGAFVDKNKSLTEILARGVAAAAGGGTGNKQAAEIAARSRMDELKLKNEQDQQNNARISASVSGLQTPSTKLPGIIDLAKRRQAALTKTYTGK